MKPDEEASWEYNPNAAENDQPESPGPDSSRPQLAPETSPVQWSASEYIDHKQGFWWFVVLALLTVGLAITTYFLTSDYFGSVFIVALGVIVGIFAVRTPRQLNYQLTNSNLVVEQKIYPYRLFKSFSIIQDGALSSLNFAPIKRYMPPISAYFEAGDQDKIVKMLEDHLPYEERNLDTVERLTRRLRF